MQREVGRNKKFWIQKGVVNKRKDYAYIFSYFLVMNSHDGPLKIRNVIDNFYAYRSEPFKFALCL